MISGQYAIAGLGVTAQGVLPGRSSDSLLWEAIELALVDSGLSRRQIGGLLLQPGIGDATSGEGAARAGIGANFVMQMNTGGTTGIMTLLTAIGMIEAEMAEYVVCAHTTTARSRKLLVGAGSPDLPAFFGMFSPGASQALCANAYFARYGRNSADLAEIGVALRAHGALRPDAFMYGKPITVADHQASAIVAAPLRKYDYCIVTDGAVAFIVTSTERAKDLKSRPVRLLGAGCKHNIAASYSGELGTEATANYGYSDFDSTLARQCAFGQAGLGIGDIDVFQFYDAFTILVAMQIESYGLCGAGEAADFIRAGHFRFDGSRPCNTSGTEHSWGYLQGFTHIAEAVRQLRGEGGPTQVANARTSLVTGVGSLAVGQPQAHACAILSSQ
jgi:acetyl-CoA acetyltransferase